MREFFIVFMMLCCLVINGHDQNEKVIPDDMRHLIPEYETEFQPVSSPIVSKASYEIVIKENEALKNQIQALANQIVIERKEHARLNLKAAKLEMVIRTFINDLMDFPAWNELSLQKLLDMAGKYERELEG